MASVINDGQSIDYCQRFGVTPECYHCQSSERVTLVDSVLAENKLGGTTPVYHCGVCNKTFNGRTQELANSLVTQGVPYTTAAVLDGSTLSGLSIEENMADVAQHEILNHPEIINLKSRVAMLESQMQPLQEFKNRVESDPLACLKIKTNNFNLE